MLAYHPRRATPGEVDVLALEQHIRRLRRHSQTTGEAFQTLFEDSPMHQPAAGTDTSVNADGELGTALLRQAAEGLTVGEPDAAVARAAFR